MTTVQLLIERLKHQQSEVREAQKKLGSPGFSAAYLKRMVGNCAQTKKALAYYKKHKKAE